MPDSAAIEAEPELQLLFSMLRVAAAALLAAAIINFSQLYRYIPNRAELGPREVPIRYRPVAFAASGFAPLALAGAWKLTAPDPRFGGASALTVDGDGLLALTDSGVLLRFPKPGAVHPTVRLNELPGGPGPATFKRNRDSESLLRDWKGRGWWVGFENRNSVWLFDRGFSHVLDRFKIRHWPRSGFEAMANDGNMLLLVPESGGRLVAVRPESKHSEWRPVSAGHISDAATLPDGTLLLVQRNLGMTGLDNRLVQVRRQGAGYTVVRSIALGVARRDNVEGLAVEPRPGGALRLWLITDDGRKEWPQRTLLIALDWPAALDGPVAI